MKKRTTSSMVLVSALAGLPLLHTPDLLAQGTSPKVQLPVRNPPIIKAGAPLKWADRYDKMASAQSIVGLANGAPVYQNARGERFTLDPVTGDMRFLAAGSTRMAKLDYVKFGGVVTILGVDASGHVVNRNAAGEKFYLNPANGDMVLVP